MCLACLEQKAAPRGDRRSRARKAPDLHDIDVDQLVREGRTAILTRDGKTARKRQREWDRLLAWYGAPHSETGLDLDMAVPLSDETIEAILFAEIASLGIDVHKNYTKDSPDRLHVSTLLGAMECLNWYSQMEGHPPAFNDWKNRHEKVWKNLQRSYLTRHAQNAATPLVLDELLRLLAWMMEPTAHGQRSAALVALALDPGLTYEGTDRPLMWSWLAALKCCDIIDLGSAGLRLTSTDQVERTVVCSPGPTADAVRNAVSSRRTPLRDDHGRTVVVNGAVQQVAYDRHLWTSEDGDPLGGQGIRHRVVDILGRVVPNLDHVTVKHGRAKLFRVDDETRERAVLRALEPTSDRLRDAAWLANAWWVAARGLEMLSRRVRHADVLVEGVAWELPRKSDSDGRRPFYGAPHLVDTWTDPRHLLLQWKERLQEEWLRTRHEPLNDNAPLFPSGLSAKKLAKPPTSTGMPNKRLQTYISGYNVAVEPEERIRGTFTSHSLRSGFAVSGRALGLPTETVMLAGDWHDYDSFLMYLRRAAPLTAGEAGTQMATRAGLGGVTAGDDLLDRVADLRPTLQSGRLCGHDACLTESTAPAAAPHPAE